MDDCWDPNDNYSIKGRTLNVNTTAELVNAGQSAQPGDGILINSGTAPNSPKIYTEELIMANSGTLDKPIIIRGVGAGKPVIRKQATNTGRVEPKSYTIIENIKTDGIQTVTSSGHGRGGYGIYIRSENNVKNVMIKNCVMQQHEKGIRAEEGDRLIVRNTVIKQTEWGTYIGTDNDSAPALEYKNTLWENVEVDESVYEDKWNTDGFLIEGGAGHHVFRNCTAHGFHDAGFDLKGHVIIDNSVSYNNGYPGGESGVGFKIWRDGLISNSIAYSNDYANYLFGGYEPDWNLVNSISYNGRVSFEDRAESSPALSAQSIKLSHNIFVNTTFNDEIEGKTGVGAFKYADHNLFFGGETPNPQGTASKTGDPKSKNISGKDFRPLTGSPVIDAGVGTVVFPMSTNDSDGNLRRAGAAVDIGPYEYGSTRNASPTPSGTPTITVAVSPTVAPSATRSQTIVEGRGDVGVNLPPAFNPVIPGVVNSGSTLSFMLGAKDPEGGAVKYRAISLPHGASLGGKFFKWRPGSNQSGSYSAVFRATDPSGAYSEQTVPIKVLKSVSLSESRWLNVTNSPREDVSFQVCRRSTYTDKYTEVITFSDNSEYLEINEPGRSGCSNYYTHSYPPGNYVMTLYLCSSRDSNGKPNNCFANRAKVIKR